MKRFGIFALSLLAVPGLALAASPNYTYVEGGYQYIDVDDASDGDGLDVGGSFAFTENFHMVASYSDLELDNNVDVSQFQLGLGVNFPVDEGLDLVFRGGYTNVEVGSFDDDGFFFTGGIRYLITDKFEINGNLEYVDLDDAGDDTGISLGALFALTDHLSLTGGVSFSDDATGMNLGVRYYFVP